MFVTVLSWNICTSTVSIFFYGSTASILAHIITASTCINYLLLRPPDVRNDALSLGISPSTFGLRVSAPV
jgi:hypothetical protein